MSLFTRSVASITKTLGNMVAELEAHAAAMRVKAEKQIEAAQVHNNRAGAAWAEASQADRVREKITGIIG